MPQDNQAELFWWVNESDQVLGSITRREAHSGSNKIHRAISVFIFSPNYSKLLLQQRSLDKDMSPGYWAESVGGHVTYGQTYQDAAVREIKEELGLNLTPTFHSKHLFSLDGEREYFTLYSAIAPPHTVISFDTDEIQIIKWVNVSDLAQFISQNLCTSGFLQSWAKIKVRLPV